MATKFDPAKLSHAPLVFASEIDGFTATSRLSRRESDIVVSLIKNITNSEEIANSLGISTHTVNNHLKSIFEKTSTKSKTEILSSFLRYAADRLQNRSLFVRKPRVLVIDDEAMICEYISNGLAERGIKSYSISDPQQVLEAIAKYNIDFVVCDVRMPTMSGMDVLKTVRQQYRVWPYFVFVTGYPDYSLEECMHSGASGFIEKPLDLDKLFRTIMGHLVESLEEKEDMLQIRSAESIALDETYPLQESELGFGGAFIPMEAAAQKKAKIAVGSVVDLVLAPVHWPSPLKVKGQVVWKRAARESGLRAGLGIRFVNMSDRDQDLFADYVRSRDIKSFIPIGESEGNGERAS
jgi:FixJ family two-component response regulator